MLKLQTLLFVESTSNSKIKKMIKRLCRVITPINRKYLAHKIEKKLQSLKDGNYIGNIIGRWKEKEIFKSELYQSIKEYDFEGIKLNGVKDYHTYLSQMYGDFMKIPPVNKRQIHVNNIYWR